KAPRFAPNQLTELVEVAQFLGGDSGLRKCIAQPKLGKLANGCRLQIDAPPAGNQIADRFIDADPDAGLMQAERHTETGNSATDDDYLHWLVNPALPPKRMRWPRSRRCTD